MMKKLYTLLSVILFCSTILYAQGPANRTARTIVADVLAQLPAQEQAEYNSQMEDLASTGEEGVMQLVGMMNPPGKGSNAQVEYALSGLSHYVSEKGREAARNTVSNAYLKALDMVNDPEIKVFIINQLQITGKNEAVAKLASYLNDKYLCSAATRALVSIKTPQSGAELVKALTTEMNDKSKKDLITGIAELQVQDTENLLMPLLGSGDEDMQKTVLYAISRVGTTESLKSLANAADKANYAMEKSGATEAYIALIKRILEQGKTKDAEKAATDLMKKAEKANQRQTREAALQIQMAAKPADISKLLQKALKDNDRNYRFAALNFASDYISTEILSDLFKILPKANKEVKRDITNWLAQECEVSEKREAIASLGTDILIKQLNSNDMDIKRVTIDALDKIGGHKTIIVLAELLASDNNEIVALAHKALTSTTGDISTAIVPVMPKAGNEGKMAALQLLASRKAIKYATTVFDLLTYDSPEVKTAAFIALRDVVSAKDLTALYQLLENEDTAHVSTLQQAVISALAEYPANKKASLTLEQMEKAHPSKNYLYYPVLASTGDSKALAIISESFAKETGSAKDGAFQALLDWKGIEAADQLYAICNDASSSSYFDRALNRFVELVSAPQLSGDERYQHLHKAMLIAKTDNQKRAIITQLGRTNTYPGMLLSAKYLDDKPVQQAAAQAVMAIALANKDFTGKNVEEMLNKVIDVLDNPDAEYQKQALRDHLASLVIPEPYVLTDEEKKEGYRILFDGTDMDQWTGNTVDYILENGCISLYPSSAHGGNLYTKDEFANFIFRFEFQLTPAANNGLGIRTPMKGDAAYVGMELQILDDDAPVYKDLAEYQYHGSVYGIIPAKRGHLKSVGEWNYQEVIANEDNIKITLNGVVILDGNLRKATKNGTADGRNHPGVSNKKGHIGFLGHGSPVKFKNIRIKELK